MTTARRQGGQFKFVIKELLGLLKTFQRQDIAFNMWKIEIKLKCLRATVCKYRPKSTFCGTSSKFGFRSFLAHR